MSVIYAIRNSTAVSDNAEVIRDQLREKAERRFACLLLLRTIRQACDLSDWYITGVYKSRFAYEFGFNKRAPKDQAFVRLAKEIRAWLVSENYERLCIRLELNADKIRCSVHQILLHNKEERLRMEPFLTEIEQRLETQNVQKENQRAG